MSIVAVLSTTVLPLDGTYTVQRLNKFPNINGIPHYIGHPTTKDIVEQLGAIPAPSKLFSGLKPGESALCFSIKQGMSTRKDQGFTSPHQDITPDMLDIRVIKRIVVDYCRCPLCGHDNINGHFCGGCGVVNQAKLNVLMTKENFCHTFDENWIKETFGKMGASEIELQDYHLRFIYLGRKKKWEYKRTILWLRSMAGLKC